MLERGAQTSRREYLSRRGWLLVPLFVVGGLLGFRWWWHHRDYVTELEDAVRQATEREIEARFGPPTVRTMTSISFGLGLMAPLEEMHRKMFGDVPDPVALQFYWELPNEGRRYVWFGRVGDGEWRAFDGIEYRGFQF